MTYDELLAAFDRLQREAFRLEVQQSYAGVPDPGWDAWKAGLPVPVRTPDTDQWLARIARDAAAGRRWYRVLVVDWPLTSYLRYELDAFAAHTAAGEEVYVADRGAHPDLAVMVDDYWMVDESFVAVMRFDEEHRPLGPEDPPEPVETFIARRDLALTHAVPLDSWVAEHRERLSA